MGTRVERVDFDISESGCLLLTRKPPKSTNKTLSFRCGSVSTAIYTK